MTDGAASVGPLPLPQRWVDELARQRTASVHPRLNLSMLPGGVSLPDGVTLDHVRADLEAGAWLARDRRRPRGWFRLGGTELQLSVRSRPAENGGHLLAVAYEATALDEVPPSARMYPEVEFVRVFDEFGCDLPVILRQLDHSHAARRQLDRSRQPPELQRHGDLHGFVSKEYGQLGTLLALLAERAARQPEREVTGVVRDDADQVRIELDEPADDLYRRRVTIRVEDEDYPTQVSRASKRVITVNPMRNWEVAAGTRVNVIASTRFGMRQNAEALSRFSRGDVEGSWEDLATLLCDPKQLRLRPATMPARFFCDDDPEEDSLNEPQRQAVAGALATRHAYLIQGPPGTGKTTVITELIQQLIAQGERVLMLAPSHVAVDEVLRRVGAKPGVRALRITWRADKVDADLHPYLFDRVGRDLARRVLREAADRQARWTRRAAELDRRITALRQLREAVERQRMASTALLQAEYELGRIRVDKDGAVAAAVQAVARAQDEVSWARRQEEQAHGAAATAAHKVAGYDQEVRPQLAALAAAASDAEAEAEALAERQRSKAEAEAAAAGWAQAIRGSEDRIRRTRDHAAQLSSMVEAGLAQATRQLSELRAALAAAPGRPGGWLERLGFGTRARLRRDEAAAEQEWRQWHGRRGELERSMAAAAAEERSLTEQRAYHAEWQRVVAQRAAAESATAATWTTSVNRVEARFAEAIGGTARWPDLWQVEKRQVREFLSNVSAGLVSFLEDPSDTERLPAWPEFSELRAVMAGYAAALADDQNLSATASQASQLRELAEATLADSEQRRLQAEAEGAQAMARATAELAERRDQHTEVTARLAEVADRAGVRQLPAEFLPRVEEELARLESERARLERYQSLRARWEQLTAGQQPDDLVEDVRRSFIRATNLVCATTKGIVSRGSQPVRDTDYDTLIVDEASRVTESEFLIGAVRARRWILAGDEHQLPPHVDIEDEYHLHALTGIYRHERGAANSLEQAVAELAAIWEEDEELHAFRAEAVTEKATQLLESGDWNDGYRETFVKAYEHISGEDDDAALLRAMLRYLVHSLFQRVVDKTRADLRQRLEVQRRMVPALSRVVRKPIYKGKYVDPSAPELQRLGLQTITTATFQKPLVLLDTSRYWDAGNRQVGHGFVNEREQKAIRWALETYDRELREAGVRDATVGLLSFYKAQAAAVERQVDRLRLTVLRPIVIDVIDAIQGQQADLVVLSFTRAADGRPGERFGRWLQDVRRLNVACTRARRALVLVGHADTLRQLRGVKHAVQFYQHLFGLFDSHPDDCQILQRFG